MVGNFPYFSVRSTYIHGQFSPSDYKHGWAAGSFSYRINGLNTLTSWSMLNVRSQVESLWCHTGGRIIIRFRSKPTVPISLPVKSTQSRWGLNGAWWIFDNVSTWSCKWRTVSALLIPHYRAELWKRIAGSNSTRVIDDFNFNFNSTLWDTALGKF